MRPTASVLRLKLHQFFLRQARDSQKFWNLFHGSRYWFGQVAIKDTMEQQFSADEMMLNLNNSYSDSEGDNDNSIPSDESQSSDDATSGSAGAQASLGIQDSSGSPKLKQNKKDSTKMTTVPVLCKALKKNDRVVQTGQGFKRQSSSLPSSGPKKKQKMSVTTTGRDKRVSATIAVYSNSGIHIPARTTTMVSHEDGLNIKLNGHLMSPISALTCPTVSQLSTMDRIIFADLDNFPFFKHVEMPFLPNSFIWGYKSCGSMWEIFLTRTVLSLPKFLTFKEQGRAHVTTEIGTEKEGSDMAISLTIGILDVKIPKSVDFFVVSKDKGFLELVNQFQHSERRVTVVLPVDNQKIDCSLFRKVN